MRSSGCGAAITRTSEPSSATSTSPPRTAVPRGRKTPSSRPWLSVAWKRLFWRVSQSSVTVAARLSSTGARPAPCASSLETWIIQNRK